MKYLKITLICILTIFASSQSFAQKIYQWRSENRAGTYNETNLLQKWPDKGPQLLWFNEQVGSGFAAPVVTNDKIIVNGEEAGTSYVFAFDLKGKLLWKTANGPEFTGSGYASNFPGARSTPTVADDLVYSSSGIGRLICLELATGKEKWVVDMQNDLGGIENEFGYAESPLIDGDVVYCTPGGSVNNVVALNRFTGKTIWTSKATGEITSFCSPLLIKLPERAVFVSLSRNNIYGLDAKNGELLWSQKLENFKYEGEHCNTPYYSDGSIYYTTADENGNGTVKLELSKDGKSIKEAWRNKSAGGAFGGMIKLNEQLFVTTGQKKLVCIDTKTGNLIDSIKPNKGSLIYADKMLYCYNESGDMKLFKFENNKFSEISKFKIDKGTKEHFSHPVISNGVMYIRHGKALMAYNIKKV